MGLNESEAKKEERRQNQEFLFKQMKDRDNQKAAEKVENENQAKVFKMQAEQSKLDDESKTQILKSKNLELQKQVLGQMGEKESFKGKKKQMNANETKMNNALLKNMGKQI